MEIKYICTYYPQVLKHDIPRLSGANSTKIKRAVEYKLQTNPFIFGLPLRGTLKARWKLRVGNYRVIYKIIGNQVQIIAIGHRNTIYDMLEKRK
jgi:mRNA interferase RelE/StbE